MFFRAFSRQLRISSPPPLEASAVLQDLGRIENFPTFSDTTVRALASLNDSRATLNEFAELVRRDAVISVSLLKMANSVVYRGRREIDDVRTAIFRLGNKGCHRVISSIGMQAIFQNRAADTRSACEGLQRHALLTASLAANINEFASLGFMGEEFTAGLLHDIGRVLLCVRVPEVFLQADPLTYQENSDILERERVILNIDHCEVGLRFARENNLPDSVKSAIHDHHFPKAEIANCHLVALINVADQVANHVQRERKIAGFELETNPGFAILRDLLRPRQIASFSADLSRAVVLALRETRTMIRISP